MLYYFVSDDGDYVYTEEQDRGYFQKEFNHNMFTQKKQLIAEQKRRIKARILELQKTLEGLK